MIQEYGKKHEQNEVVLPILCVRVDGFDLETFLEVSGMQWDGYSVLKPFVIVISVLEFFDKSASLVLGMGRSIQVLSFRVCISICMGMIRVEIWIQKNLCIDGKIFDFHGYVFQSFPCIFDTNHVQSL